MTSINEHAFNGCTGLLDVYCFTDSVPQTSPNSFEDSNIPNATLHVKANWVDAYKAVEPWKNFNEIVTLQQCSKPTIQYNNGKLYFNSDTEGAVFHSTINDSDIKSYSGNEVQLCVTYIIDVYATKTGYEDSDVTTATVCWIDADPMSYGIANAVSDVLTNAVLIQNNGNIISISGVNEGTAIKVFDVSGKIVGSAIATPSNTNIPTSLSSGEICIVKIGDKAIKLLMK